MNSKKVISAVLLVSDGPVEHEYFEKLLTINNSELINLIDEINANFENADIGFFIKYNDFKSDIVTKSEISERHAKDVLAFISACFGIPN